MARPRVNSEGQKSLDHAQTQFDNFKDQVESFNPLDCKAPSPLEQEPQTKLSSKEMGKTDAPYIKPMRSINSKEKFDEKFRKHWEKDWEYVKCVVENYEIVGEQVEIWTKKYAGDPAHFWKLPVNKPIYIPRLLARQLSECKYHKLVMQDTPTNSEGGMQFYGAMVVDQTKQRLDAKPVNNSFSLGF